MSNSNTEELYAFRSASNAQNPTAIKFATLSPYLAQIQKRKKAKSVLRENHSKNKNENSSKSFRIKDRSSSSLRSQNKKQLNNKTIASIINKINSRSKQQSIGERNTAKLKLKQDSKYRDERKYKQYREGRKERERGEREQRKHREQKLVKGMPSSTCTVKQDVDEKSGKNKNMSFRKNKFESKSRNEMTISNDENENKNKKTIEVSKYGYTDTNRTIPHQQPTSASITTKANPKLNTKHHPKNSDHQLSHYKEHEQEGEQGNLYGVGKKKFRRGKYEALYSSVNSNELYENHEQPTKSQSQLQISKKQSNVSIHKDVDLMAEKEMQRFYRQMRSKQIRKSLQKSTEYYFKQDRAYRAPKSNNDIEIYVSTVKNPSYNRQSNASTFHSNRKQAQISMQSKGEERKKEEPGEREMKDSLWSGGVELGYDFEFKDMEAVGKNMVGILEIENGSEEESMVNENINLKMQEKQMSFEKQRKQVEREYFHKKSPPHIDWSDQDCQIDQL